MADDAAPSGTRRWVTLESEEGEVPLVPRKSSRHGWCQLCAAWLVFLVTGGVYQVPATLLGGRCANATAPCSIAEELPEVTSGMLGWLPATFLLAKGCLALPAGCALRRFGAQRCIVLGATLLTASAAAFAFASSYAQLLLLYICFGIAYCLAGLTPLVVFTNSHFPHQRKATSIGLLVTGFSAAGVVWPSLTAAVAQAHGWRVAAALLPMATLGIALPIASLLMRDGRFSEPPVRPPGSDVGPPSSAHAAARPAPPSSDLGACRGHESAPGLALDADKPRAAAISPTPTSPAISAISTISGGSRWPRDPAVWHLGVMSVYVLYVVNAVQVRAGADLHRTRGPCARRLRRTAACRLAPCPSLIWKPILAVWHLCKHLCKHHIPIPNMAALICEHRTPILCLHSHPYPAPTARDERCRAPERAAHAHASPPLYSLLLSPLYSLLLALPSLLCKTSCLASLSTGWSSSCATRWALSSPLLASTPPSSSRSRSSGR